MHHQPTILANPKKVEIYFNSIRKKKKKKKKKKLLKSVSNE